MSDLKFATPMPIFQIKNNQVARALLNGTSDPIGGIWGSRSDYELSINYKC